MFHPLGNVTVKHYSVHCLIYFSFTIFQGFPDIMVVMEFAPGGTLLELLVASRCYDIDAPGTQVTSLTMKQMVYFMSDIAFGMEFLASVEVCTKYRNLNRNN